MGLLRATGVIAETMDTAMDCDRRRTRREFGLQVAKLLSEFMEGEEAVSLPYAMEKPLCHWQQLKITNVFLMEIKARIRRDGVYSPAPVMTQKVIQTVMSRIIGPNLGRDEKLGFLFSGICHASLMITLGGPSLLNITRGLVILNVRTVATPQK